MKTLVTGGCGFLGKYVVQELKAVKSSVKLLTTLTPYAAEQVRPTSLGMCQVSIC